ncbi:MAG: hypothetical protein ACOY9Y_12105 [Bacillota bacterium]
MILIKKLRQQLVEQGHPGLEIFIFSRQQLAYPYRRQDRRRSCRFCN